MLNLPAETWLRFGVWMALGVVVYFAYGRRRSLLAPGREDEARAAASRAD
jgi:APA family basic amino acid/polyamine antiporter